MIRLSIGTFLRTIVMNASKIHLTRQKLLIVKVRYGNRRSLNYWSINSKAAVRRFLKKGFLKNFANFARKYLCCRPFQEYFFSEHLRTAARYSVRIFLQWHQYYFVSNLLRYRCWKYTSHCQLQLLKILLR